MDSTRTFRSPRHDREVRVADWRDAEELAAWHMQHVLGLHGVALTAAGADGGLDVVAERGVAQVKHYGAAVGSPDVQRIRGAGHGHELVLFYALVRYTSSALAFADAASVALFRYDVYGDVAPVNSAAENLLAISRGEDEAHVPAEAREPQPVPEPPAAAEVLLMTEQAARTRRERESAEEREHARAAEVLDRAHDAAAAFAAQFAGPQPWTSEQLEDLRTFVILAAQTAVRLAESVLVRSRHPSPGAPWRAERIPLVSQRVQELGDEVATTLSNYGLDAPWHELMLAVHRWAIRAAALEGLAASADEPGSPRSERTIVWWSAGRFERADPFSVPGWWDNRYGLERHRQKPPDSRRWELRLAGLRPLGLDDPRCSDLLVGVPPKLFLTGAVWR